MKNYDMTKAKDDLCNIIETVLNGEAVVITSKKGNVVMLSESDWEGIRETLYLMGDPEFLNDIRDARNTPVSEREVWIPRE
ncbi:MAG: type II toxin-antitoxin system Phd/YefM family antitoxin [Methanomassiliicoccaceae archaeon]|nr:type II toxin-antitoxin system Phd/YefM family antitoxin [Methanomassiliicoccaceae archaeon]